MWTFGGLVIGTDPIAIDFIMLKGINQQPITLRLKPVETATHLRLTETAGLGNHSLAKIELIEEIFG
jgi:hypothetical protein